jgi:hypothetical protein
MGRKAIQMKITPGNSKPIVEMHVMPYVISITKYPNVPPHIVRMQFDGMIFQPYQNFTDVDEHFISCLEVKM